MAQLNFNANDYEPTSTFEPIPYGKYQAVITSSEMRVTKAGTGQYLQLEFVIIEGDYEGRKLWSRLNLDNPNPDAVRIAQSDLSAICRAVNVLEVQNSEQLHNLPLTIHVVKETLSDGFVANDIKGYEKIEQQVVPQQPVLPKPAARSVSLSATQRIEEAKRRLTWDRQK